MIFKFYRSIKYNFNPPKKGDVYYGDALYFVVGRPIEHVLHGLLDKYGKPIVDVVPSEDCYRLILDKASHPQYYIFQSEVFCVTPDSFKWMVRTQPRRINKDTFKQMIVDGLLRKGNTP